MFFWDTLYQVLPDAVQRHCYVCTYWGLSLQRTQAVCKAVAGVEFIMQSALRCARFSNAMFLSYRQALADPHLWGVVIIMQSLVLGSNERATLKPLFLLQHIKDILTKVQAGYRMDCPDRCEKPVYDLMLKCWLKEPKDRLSFAQVATELEKIHLTWLTGGSLGLGEEAWTASQFILARRVICTTVILYAVCHFTAERLTLFMLPTNILRVNVGSSTIAAAAEDLPVACSWSSWAGAKRLQRAIWLKLPFPVATAVWMVRKTHAIIFSANKPSLLRLNLMYSRYWPFWACTSQQHRYTFVSVERYLLQTKKSFSRGLFW